MLPTKSARGGGTLVYAIGGVPASGRAPRMAYTSVPPLAPRAMGPRRAARRPRANSAPGAGMWRLGREPGWHTGWYPVAVPRGTATVCYRARARGAGVLRHSAHSFKCSLNLQRHNGVYSSRKKDINRDLASGRPSGRDGGGGGGAFPPKTWGFLGARDGKKGGVCPIPRPARPPAPPTPTKAPAKHRSATRGLLGKS